MSTFLAAPAPFTGSGVDPWASLAFAGLGTFVLMVWLVRYASRRSREEAAREHESAIPSRRAE